MNKLVQKFPFSYFGIRTLEIREDGLFWHWKRLGAEFSRVYKFSELSSDYDISKQSYDNYGNAAWLFLFAAFFTTVVFRSSSLLWLTITFGVLAVFFLLLNFLIVCEHVYFRDKIGNYLFTVRLPKGSKAEKEFTDSLVSKIKKSEGQH